MPATQTVTRFVPANAAFTTFGPDAFTPDFVKAVRATAKDAPEVTYDGAMFICGDQHVLSQRLMDDAIKTKMQHRWIAARLGDIGFCCATMHVEEALWSKSVRGKRVR